MKTYPTKEQTYFALATHKIKDGKFDYETLDPFLKGPPIIDEDGNESPTRDLGATVTCLTEIVKDLIVRIDKLEKL